MPSSVDQSDRLGSEPTPCGYVTNRGIARYATDGLVDLLDVDDTDLRSVLQRDPNLTELLPPRSPKPFRSPR